MADFEKGFKKVIANEGGYVNDKDDKGGETFMGITRKNHPNLAIWKIIDDYIDMYNSTYGLVKYIKNNEAAINSIKSVYKKQYWDKLLLDKINSQRVANELFDDCVNRGVNATLRLIRQLYKFPNKSSILQMIPTINSHGKK